MALCGIRAAVSAARSHQAGQADLALRRWAGIGPYYAMFPTPFAFAVVSRFTRPGDAVLDPFAGRASSIYAAATTGRSGLGVEINEVGWLYGRAKLQPARTVGRVLRRLDVIEAHARELACEPPEEGREFFELCYTLRVYRFLEACRSLLKWRTSIVDATLMAIILVYLHGKRKDSLSNQMRHAKAMHPEYSVRWWRARGLPPPDLDPAAFLRQRIEWRYAKGVPELAAARVVLGDSRRVLPRLAGRPGNGRPERYRLLFTSPPYSGVTNYECDQWLRLWMLGAPPRPTHSGEFTRGRLYDRQRYTELLREVFSACAPMMEHDAVVYVRTDAREFTRDTTIDALRQAFPQKSLQTTLSPYSRSTQTALFGDDSPKPGEVDLVLT